MAGSQEAMPADRDLVVAMAAGDTDALRSLNTRYGRMLAALAQRFLGNEFDAEEVVADVLWQAWRDARTFDARRGSVSVWLVTLARSRAIDRIRTNRARQIPAAEQPAAESAADPAVQIHQFQRVRMVRTALTSLEVNERAALELAYFSDLSQSEVAEKLGLPLGTVKTRIRSAMLKLRESLAGRNE